MNYDNWPLLVGEEEKREWNDRKYRFRTNTNKQDEMKQIESLESKTPLRHFIESGVGDKIIRGLSFLSYYQINPTFENGGDVGNDFFWFPLDELNDDRYELLLDLIGEDEDKEDNDKENESEDSDEDELLPDFPVMSTVSRPVIEAATSKTYTNQIGRKSEDKRREILQEQIKERKREMVEEVEEWLEKGTTGKYPDRLSAFSFYVGRLPAAIILSLIDEEKQRIDNIYEVFRILEIPSDEEFDSGPEFLLQKLNSLSEEYPVFEKPAIESFCLDENNRDCEYHVTKHRGLEVQESLNTCEYCGSDLFRIFRAGLDDTVQEAWMMGLLPELMVARLLQEADWTSEVIPHRMVQMVDENGELTSSVEVDVTVYTEDDHVLFVEVTSQRDALGRLVTKKTKFNDTGIEYDGIVQISPLNNNQMVKFDERVVSASGWMIQGIESEGFKEDLYKEIDSLPA